VLEGARYHFVVVLPQEESEGAIEGLVQRAIEKYFRLVIRRETRSLEVYVVTAPSGVTATKLLELGGGGAMISCREFQVDIADAAPSGDQRVDARRRAEGRMRCLRLGHNDRRLL
jgi:hypothetical protein